MSSSPIASSVAALRVADGKRGKLRVPLGGEIANASCIRCGAKATQRRLLLIDGTYRYRTILVVVGGVSALIPISLVAVAPLLMFMRRQSRHRMRIHVGMCAVCDDWLRKRAIFSRVLEGLAAFLPLAGSVAGFVVGSALFGIGIGPLIGGALALAAVYAINRRNPDDHAELKSADATGWLLDVPATWKNALAADPNPEVAAMVVEDG